MKANDLNRYPIRKYLAGLNIYPAKEKGYYGMYHSPFREDSNASMKVDYDKNLWIDYGSNDGGTLIDLVMRIERCSNGEAMEIGATLIRDELFFFSRKQHPEGERTGNYHANYRDSSNKLSYPDRLSP